MSLLSENEIGLMILAGYASDCLRFFVNRAHSRAGLSGRSVLLNVSPMNVSCPVEPNIR
jgi:hypothetical protein